MTKIATLEQQLKSASDPRLQRTLRAAIARLKASENTQKPQSPKTEPQPQSSSKVEKLKKRAIPGQGKHQFVVGIMGRIEGETLTTSDGGVIPVSIRPQVNTWLKNNPSESDRLIIGYPRVKNGQIISLTVASIKDDSTSEFIKCCGSFSPDVGILLIQLNMAMHKRFKIMPHSFASIPENAPNGWVELELTRNGDQLIIQSIKSMY